MWSFRRKKKQPSLTESLETLFAAEDELRQSGFRLYLNNPAPRDMLCVFVRAATSHCFHARPGEFDPMFNVADLWWRPWEGVTVDPPLTLH